jgi:DNA-binding MarR family transcriptional regulator
MARGLGVTGPQRFVIRLIGRLPGLSAGELAATLRTDPSTLTGVLQRLEAARLIRRARDPKDGRRVLLSLTTRGRGVDRLNSGTIENAVKVALRDVSPRDLACTARVMRQMASSIMEAGGRRVASGNASGNGAGRQRLAPRRGSRPPSRTRRRPRSRPSTR